MSSDMSHARNSNLWARLGFVPPGLLLASGLILNSPLDHHISTIYVPIFAVLFSAFILVYRSVLQARNFSRMVGILALGCVLHRAYLHYTRALNNVDEKSFKTEVLSCLREISALSACLCSAIIMGCFNQTREELRHDRIDLETAPVGVPPRGILDSSLVPGNSDHISNNDPLLFRFLGPPSNYQGSSDSVISLSTASNRVRPDVIQTMTAVNWSEMHHDESASTNVEVDL